MNNYIDLPVAGPARAPLAHLGALVRAQVRALSDETESRGERVDLAVAGEPKPVRADAQRLSEAIGGLLASAVRYSAPGARLQAGVGFGPSQAVISIGIEGDGVLDLERTGVLHASLAGARAIIEENGGSLRISGRWLSAFLPVARA
jgi:hypothetical protein